MGLQVLRRALLDVPGLELAVIAPDTNRSATARSITTRRPIWVEEVDFGDGTVGYATDGTPVDCVRFASLGLVEGFQADLVVSGINHGSNLGAVAEGRIAVTPIHFDLTDRSGMDALAVHGLARLLVPAAREVE